MNSCKRDKDNEAPNITVSKPYENQQFSVYDTITIKAIIGDETVVEQVDFTITDDNKVPVQPTTSLFFSQKDVSITSYIHITNKNLSSGNYYLWIRATDGTNIRNKYIRIFIYELERKLDQVFVFGYADTTTINVYTLDSNILIKAFDYHSDYCATAINSEFGILYSCGKFYGNLFAFNTSDYSTLWGIPVVSNPPFPFFNDIFYCNKLLYTSFYNGFVRGYDLNGSVKYAAIAPNNIIPDKIYAKGNFLFCDHSLVSGSNRIFGLYYLVSGASKQQISSTMKVVTISEQSNNSIFVFGNENYQGKIYLYDIDGNGWWESHPVPSGSIFDVAVIDNNNFLIAHTNGIYHYDYSMNSLTLFKAGNAFSKIKFDSVSQELYVVSGNEIIVYNYPDGTFFKSYSIPNQILDFQLLYNK